MSTNNGPMPPANPYDGGGISTQIQQRNQSLIGSGGHRSHSKKNTGFYIFFLDCLKNSPLFSLAAFLVFSIFILSIIELWISFTHLAEYQKLLEKNLEPSTRDMENINSLRNSFSLFGFILALLVIAFFSCFTKSIMKILDEYPQRVFIFMMVLGGVSAFFVPQFLYSFKYIGDTKDVTTTLLTVTGGVLAIFTLLKTHQKNILDKETLDFERQKYAESIEDRKKDIAKQEKLRQEQKSQFNMTLAQQKDKDSQEHIRQVHAERRARYAKAIEHIGNDKSAVRLGGIYTLISLIDEWLADKNIEAPEDRRKEGQIVIDSLCAYIRSPFHLADKRDILESDTPPDNYDGNFTSDREEFLEESNIRKSIFREINKRITITIDENNIHKRYVSGTWSKFTFDFFAAPIFYILQYYTYVNTSFHAARFYGKAFFNNSHFFGTTDFTDAIFYGPAEFNDTFFIGKTSFQWVNFHGPTSFLSVFTEEVTFENAEFISSIKFASSFFEGPVSFKEVKFSEDPDFAGYECIVSNDLPGVYISYNPAVFSYKIDSKEHNFASSNFEISLGKVNFKNNDYEIPEDTIVFNPDSWDKNQNDYIDKSQPAKK